jgi:hypothetical protein
MQQIAKVFIIGISSVICFSLVFKMYKNSAERKWYQVSSSKGETYITNYVLEKHGCIFFIDDDEKIQRKICGSYSVIKI